MICPKKLLLMGTVGSEILETKGLATQAELKPFNVNRVGKNNV